MRLPREKIIFTADIVTPGRIAFGNMPDFYPLYWVPTLGTIEHKLDYTRVIPDHGPPTVPPSAVGDQRVYLEDPMARGPNRAPDRAQSR